MNLDAFLKDFNVNEGVSNWDEVIKELYLEFLAENTKKENYAKY